MLIVKPHRGSGNDAMIRKDLHLADCSIFGPIRGAFACTSSVSSFSVRPQWGPYGRNSSTVWDSRPHAGCCFDSGSQTDLTTR